MNPDFSEPCIIACYGRPGSGKSHLAKYIIGKMYADKKLDFIYCITGTPYNNFYQEFIDESFITTYSDAKLLRLLNFCKKYKENKKVLVLDDVMGSVRFNANVFKYLMNNFRHLGLTLIIISQYINATPPNYRNNVKYEFVFYQDIERAIEASYQSNCYGYFDTPKEWGEYLKKHCKQYICIFIDKTQKEKDKRFRKFKAPAKIPKFLIQLN